MKNLLPDLHSKLQEVFGEEAVVDVVDPFIENPKDDTLFISLVVVLILCMLMVIVAVVLLIW